jgi:translation initiation factor eIF-2B subunit epsilon
VNEVYLMCSSHADQIQEYIDSSKWNSSQSPFTISTVMSLESRSVGDAMRDLDNRGLITGDFILISGDVVTNIDFAKAHQIHKNRRLQDKDQIVTMILTQASPLHRTRSPVDPATFFIDKKTKRCLYYQGINAIDCEQSSINIDPEILENIEDEFEIRNDLIDCQIDICSPHVPQIFQENFDYQFLRDDFIKGVLTSDLLRKNIYTYISDDTSEYAARVESWATYSAVSQDILARWCYPITPDSNFTSKTTYSYETNHVYKEEQVILAQSCRIGSCTSIGTKTEIGDGSSIEKSVIGKNCKIGNNVIIHNSFIWNNTVIKDNTTINNALVASDVTLGKNVVLNPGVVIGFNVVIGDDKVIPHKTRIVEKPIQQKELFDSFSDDEDEDEDKEANSGDNFDLVGDNGIGVLYESEIDSEFEEEDEEFDPKHYSGMVYKFKTLNLSDDSIASLTTKKMKKQARKTRRMSTNSVVSTDFEGGVYSDFDEEDFNKEAVATVERAIENNHDIDTALLELNTLRMSMNVTYHEVRSATIEAMFKCIVKFIATDTLQPQEATEKIFKKWGSLFKRQVFDDSDKQDLLNNLQEKVILLDRQYNHIIFFWSIRTLYDLDIVDEDDIIEWWQNSDSENSHVRQTVAKFVEWLQEAEEESD